MIGSINTDVWEGVRRFGFEQERVGTLEVYLEEMRPGGRCGLREQFESHHSGGARASRRVEVSLRQHRAAPVQRW